MKKGQQCDMQKGTFKCKTKKPKKQQKPLTYASTFKK